MRIVIVSNITNGTGLQKDYELLRAHLESLGHEVTGQQFDQPAVTETFALGIWLETINEQMVSLAPRWWYFANPEWLRPEFIKPIQRHCEKVFAKTREAERVLREKFSNVHYVGFLTEDKRNTNQLVKVNACLHIGGNSGMRNTNAVIEAWRSYRYWGDDLLPPLTIVSRSNETMPFEDTPGVTFIKRATDEQITEFQNSHLFHVMPSATEGFGHSLHEAQSVGAIILTTQAPPMSELKAPFEVKPCDTKQVRMGTLYEVSPVAIREMVPKMAALPSYETARMQVESRLRFEKGNREFAALFAPHLEAPRCYDLGRNIPSDNRLAASPPLRIAMLGNFVPPHSTENDLLWTLRDMGHKVITFQENEDRAEDILACCIRERVDLFLYVHTHGYIVQGNLPCTIPTSGIASTELRTTLERARRSADSQLEDTG